MRNPVVTIGTFDGVHTGHFTILKNIVDKAKLSGGESVLLTFSPHPRMVLYPEDQELRLLNTDEEKANLVANAGVDHLVVYPFSQAFSRKSAFEYVRDLLVRGLAAKIVVVGYDHRFGRHREGDLVLLKEFGEMFNFEVDEIPAHVVDSVHVSSTKIRNALRAGNIEEANQFLGYNYHLNGTVIHGDGRGKELGFPTANIRVNNDWKMIPGKGVYKVICTVRGDQHTALMNIGVRPTFENANHGMHLEVHIPSFANEIYGEPIQIEFLAKLRDEKKFTTVEELKWQIHQDIRQVFPEVH